MLTKCSLIVILFFQIATSAMAVEVKFPSAKLEASDPQEMISAQLHRPEGAGPYPATILLHTCGGMSSHMTHDWPRFLVELGYVVLVPDTLGSRGYHKGCAPMRNRFATQARDAYGALDYLAGLAYVDAHRVAAIGFSLGAITINEVIMTRAPRQDSSAEFKAFASLYGRCRDMKPGTIRNTPLLQIIPEKDLYAPICIERSKSIEMDAHVFAGTYHAFDQPQRTEIRPDPFGNPMLYDASATEKARSLIREFLNRQIK